MTRNITLAIDEKVLAKVRRIAAEKDTSVNAMVREYLTRMATRDDRADKARQRLLELSKASDWDPGSNWKWDREAVYDRDVFSRHQHSALRSDEDQD